MSGEGFLCVLVFVILYGAVSKRLETGVITGPMCFVGFGMLMGSGGLDMLGLDPEQPLAHALAELTLVLVLFTDAARIDLRALRRELGLPVRLLAVGMPLTIAAGTGLAAWLFADWSFWEAALLGAILAPTDAALGQAVVSSKAVPQRVRQALNVESGLNDGIALPLIMILAALAAAGAGEEARTTAEWALYAAKQVTLGPLVGIAVGLGGGFLLRSATKQGWMNESFYRLSGLALALLAFEAAGPVGGNGFIAAFVGGMTMGNTSRDMCEGLYGFLEAEGQLMMLLIFMLFGSALALPALHELSAALVLYAVASLTLLRMLPVAVSLIGAGVRPSTTLFLGWFGPRGLASILFGLLILEEEHIPYKEEIFAVVTLTVFFSVLAHGLTAVPGARSYGNLLAQAHHADAMEHAPATPHPLRKRLT